MTTTSYAPPTHFVPLADIHDGLTLTTSRGSFQTVKNLEVSASGAVHFDLADDRGIGASITMSDPDNGLSSWDKPRYFAQGREEGDSCQALTPGCSINHTYDNDSCEGY